MALDRWIALVILCITLVYGYTAFFSMDAVLPPFMRHEMVWPSSFPKVLSVAACITALVILLGLEKPGKKASDPDVDYRRLTDYHWRQALCLLALMVAYALFLRPLGFIAATTGFLIFSSLVLGERNLYRLLPITVAAAFIIWLLVDKILGIFLRPWPWFSTGV